MSHELSQYLVIALSVFVTLAVFNARDRAAKSDPTVWAVLATIALGWPVFVPYIVIFRLVTWNSRKIPSRRP